MKSTYFTIKRYVYAVCCVVWLSVTYGCKKGDMGPIGPRGEQGIQGIQGERGTDGQKGDKGDRGATGPKGEKGDKGDRGPQGERGPQGPRGTTGEQGPPGTANVMYSDWLDPDWNRTNTPDRKLHHFAIPELTDEFLDNGGIALLYIRINILVNAPEISLMPRETTILNARAYSVILPDVNAISVMVTKGDALTIPSALADAEFKYVLIPGGVNISGLAAKGISLDDYQQVRLALGIK